jgi:ubiquinone/menaquinone biosynthesis C-methylase UbiE
MTTAEKVQPQKTVDLVAIKGRQQVAWSTGDYAVIGGTLVIVSETLCDAVDVHAGQRVLDVATGGGNAAIAAARYGCDVTGIDYVPSLLERARERAAAEHLTAKFQEGDAENIPCPDASFDVVLSVFGVMFAPDHPQAARELLRVCRSGGKIGMANWTPDGFIGQMFRVIGQHVPPAPGLKSPMLWGTETQMSNLFAAATTSLEMKRRNYVFRYKSAQHFVDTFRTYYGPMQKAFNALDTAMQTELNRDLTSLLQQFNRGGAATLAVPSEYLEVIAIKK